MSEKDEKIGGLAVTRESRRARNAKVSHDVIDLYLKGLSGINIRSKLKEIGFSIGIKKINALINKEIAAWIRDKNDLIENLKAQELAKINRLEFEYWEAWQRSCKETTAKTTEKVVADQKVEIAAKKPKFDISKISELKKSNSGDARFLDGIQWCVEMRCKLLGLDAMQKPPSDSDSGNSNNSGTIININRVVFTTRKVQEG